ncbi:MAG: NDP-sugar synthase [Capsulimonadales bacterium]|nr:NDP-sugar synthase [Capsulimonadales bacterium]
MRAIVFVSGVPEDITLAEEYVTPLLPLVDRPFLQHVVEFLVEGGVTDFDFVASHLPDRIELLLGDGTRWGSRFRFHPASDDSRRYATFRWLGTVNEPTILVHADRLPLVDLPALKSRIEKEGAAASVRDGKGEWTGWAALASGILAEAPALADESALQSWLDSLPGTIDVVADRCLEVRSFAGLLQAQRAVASGAFPSLLQTGRTIVVPGQESASPEGIRLGRGVSLHPSVRLIAPVFLGENSRIGENTTLGPNVVIGENVLIGEQTTVRDALLLPGTYVGDGLELTEIVADRGRVWSVRHGDAVSVPDAFLVGNLQANPVADWVGEMQSRLIAALLLLLCWPALLLTTVGLLLFRRAPLFHRHEFVVLPTTPDRRDWRTRTFVSLHPEPNQLRGPEHFLLHMLPGLFAVCQGALRLVGVRPRGADEIADLPGDFRGTYLRGRMGLITETPPTAGASLEERLTAEAFYAATASPRQDLMVLRQYFRFGGGGGGSAFLNSKV